MASGASKSNECDSKTGQCSCLSNLICEKCDQVKNGFYIKDLHNIDDWMYTTLNSRYCIKKSHMLDSNNKITEMCEIGVEDPKELTMLSLGCPYLHKN